MSTSTIKGFTGEHRFLSLAYPLDKPVVEKVGPVKFRYPTLRKAYHAHRTNDLTLKAHVINSPSDTRFRELVPTEKERPDWPMLRERVLYRLLKQKFSNPGLRQRLLATGTAELIHIDNEDRFWGQSVTGDGENRLGVLLMRLRDEYLSMKNEYAA